MVDVAGVGTWTVLVKPGWGGCGERGASQSSVGVDRC